MQFGEKNVQHPEKINIQWLKCSENQFKIVLYNKIYTIKNVCCWKKISLGGSFYNIKLLSQNIATI